MGGMNGVIVITLLTIKGNFATLSAMTRQWRIEFEGAYYHILSRGNERRNIFNDNQEIGKLFGLGYSSIKSASNYSPIKTFEDMYEIKDI
ncbi:MAG: hypothetical protein A2099_04840 [Planctomycetes bacterium GWF2_39_10]|nr:MAG: hypothetical protein A2099_04840 [Planctomycetes bacterium GWF2_39_10]